MTLTNPLASNPHQVAAIRATRLYVLARDAYLARPKSTLHKLAALEELRRCTTPRPVQTLPKPGEPWPTEPGRQAASTPPGFDASAGSTGGAGGLFGMVEAMPAASPWAEQAPELTGVRLVTWLRELIHEQSIAMTAPDAALALLDVMTGSVPPRHAATSPAARTSDTPDWSVDPQALIIDAGGYLAPELPIATIHRLARLHRTSRRFLLAGSRFGLPSRALNGADEGPEAAVADMMGAVLGLRPESARAGAVTLLDVGALEATPGIAGGVVFDRLSGCTGPEAFVGTRLACRAPADLIHHLATVECALRVRPGLKPAVCAALAALYQDVCSLAPGDDTEATRVRAGRRALELSVLRLGAGERGRISTIAAHRHLPRPRRWVEPASTA